jgi:hypothetical protein
MPPAEVIPFQITVGPRGPTGYLVRAGSAGQRTEATLNGDLWLDDPRVLGARMGRWLFVPSIHRLLIAVARQAEPRGARIQLRLEIQPPELANLPWEYLAIGEAARWQPGLREDYTLVRAGARSHRPIPPVLIGEPLRLLIAAARGAESAAEQLGRALLDPIRSGSLVVDRMLAATAEDLIAELQAEPRHFVHLLAPVEQLPRTTPRLRLGRQLTPTQLAGLLATVPELRLVTLSGAAADPLGEFAAALHEADGRAVVSLGGAAPADVAVFSAALYQHLVLPDAVDVAVTAGRRALADTGGSWGLARLHLTLGGEELARTLEPPLAGIEPSTVRRLSPQRRSNGRFAVTGTRLGEPAQRPRRRSPRRLNPAVPALLLAAAVLVWLLIQLGS